MKPGVNGPITMPASRYPTSGEAFSRCAIAPNANASTRPTTMVETSGEWCGIAAPWLAAQRASVQSYTTSPVNSERETIAQIATVGNDSCDDAALGLVGDQHVELIELVHCDQLQDLDAHRPSAWRGSVSTSCMRSGALARPMLSTMKSWILSSLAPGLPSMKA